jgi:hypothetical protein
VREEKQLTEGKVNPNKKEGKRKTDADGQQDVKRVRLPESSLDVPIIPQEMPAAASLSV